MAHPQHACADCGRICDARCTRCWPCHVAHRAVEQRTCADCGVPIFRQSTRCRPCRNAARRARRITFNGYVRVWMPEHPLASRHGYVLEHRLVLHDAGVHVPRGHDVHHRNGDKQDNRLENLELLPAGEHTRRHILERGTITNQYGTFPLRGALDTGNGVRA